jgi:hypothetical protein
VRTGEPNIGSPFFTKESGGAVGGRRLPDGALICLSDDGRLLPRAQQEGCDDRRHDGGTYFRVADARILLNDIRHL